MKTYLMDCFNRYKRFSEGLDVKTILCNKSWWVFNDSGEKEIYIFQEDGTVIASLNGNVTMANWKYLLVNKSLIINTKEQSYMFHPAFSDNNILALQKDGTEQYSFMIIEEQLNHFQPRALSELNAYFERRIQAQIEVEQRKTQEEENEKQRRLQLKIEAERRENQRKSEEIEEKKRKLIEAKRNKKVQEEINNALSKNRPYNIAVKIYLCGFVFIILVLYVLNEVLGLNINLGVSILTLIFWFIGGYIYCASLHKEIRRKVRDEIIKQDIIQNSKEERTQENNL